MPNSTKSSTQGDAEFKYRWIDGVERLERYQTGGYHPVLIGDVLAKRYRVVHKLGYGSYSTIWLAHDMQRAEYVAVKICTADAPTHEVEALRALAKSPSGYHPGRAMIPLIQDQFELLGPNGKHRCYTMHPARSSVSAAKFSLCSPVTTARVVVAQLILAVAYTHYKGYVHGDIHLGNVLFRLPSNFNRLSTDQLYATSGEPRTEAVVSLDGKPLPPGVPSYGTVPIWLGKHVDRLAACEADILLGDFGEVFSPATQQRRGNDCHAPLPVLPPEVIFEPQQPISFPSDIWALGCAIWPVLGMRSLFDGTLATRDDIASQQIEVLGASSFPTEWFRAWDNRHEFFDGTGLPVAGRSVFPSLEDLFEEEVQAVRQEEKVDAFDTNEKAAILSMLRGMLVFRPQERASAEALVESQWMVNWGLPELEKYGKYPQ